MQTCCGFKAHVSRSTDATVYCVVRAGTIKIGIRIHVEQHDVCVGAVVGAVATAASEERFVSYSDRPVLAR